MFLFTNFEVHSQEVSYKNISFNGSFEDTILINKVKKIKFNRKYYIDFCSFDSINKAEVFSYKRYRFLKWNGKDYYLKVATLSKPINESEALEYLCGTIVKDSFENNGVMKRMLMFFFIDENGLVKRAGQIRSTFDKYLDNYIRNNLSNFKKITFVPSTIKGINVSSIICLQIDPYNKSITYTNNFFQNDSYFK